jgi:MoaA/NifB/PqqE/SkfB family radical SAM enzyme
MIFDPQVKLTLHDKYRKFCEGERVFPISVELSICGKCQATCRRCPSANFKNNEMMDTKIALRLLNELYEKGSKSVIYVGGGEPSLHPGISKIMNSCRIRQGMFSNCLSGIRYNPEKLSFIRVTITDEKIPEYNLKKIKECQRVGLRINYIEGDQWKVKKTIELADKYNYDYVQVVPALKRGDTFTNEVFDSTEYKSEKLIVGEYKFSEQNKPRSYTRCYGYHFVPFVWENGNVTTCAYIKDDLRYILGNIRQESMFGIMTRSARYAKVSKICQQCCKNHEINKLINKALSIEDVDFV